MEYNVYIIELGDGGGWGVITADTGVEDVQLNGVMYVIM